MLLRGAHATIEEVGLGEEVVVVVAVVVAVATVVVIIEEAPQAEAPADHLRLQKKRGVIRNTMRNLKKDPGEEVEVAEVEVVEGATVIIIAKDSAVILAMITPPTTSKTETKTEIMRVEEAGDLEDFANARDAHHHAALMTRNAEMSVTVEMILNVEMIVTVESIAIAVMTETVVMSEMAEIVEIAGTTGIVEIIARTMVTDEERTRKGEMKGIMIRTNVAVMIGNKMGNDAVLDQREDLDRVPDEINLRVKERVQSRVESMMQFTRLRSRYQTLRFKESSCG